MANHSRVFALLVVSVISMFGCRTNLSNSSDLESAPPGALGMPVRSTEYNPFEGIPRKVQTLADRKFVIDKIEGTWHQSSSGPCLATLTVRRADSLVTFRLSQSAALSSATCDKKVEEGVVDLTLKGDFFYVGLSGVRSTKGGIRISDKL